MQILFMSARLCKAHTNSLDHLKADILQYVLEHEESGDEAQAAAQILEYILGTGEGTSSEDWEVAKAILRDEAHDNANNDLANEETITDVTSENEIVIVEPTPTTESSVSLDTTEVKEPEETVTVNESVTEESTLVPTEVTDPEEIVTAIDSVIEEICDVVEEHNVTATAEYTMQSVDGASTASIILQLLETEQVILLCNFSSLGVNSDSCNPEIYLVSGSSTCQNLPSSRTVTAKKLAEVEQQGYGETMVDISWTEQQDKCIMIVSKDDCHEDVVEARFDTRR